MDIARCPARPNKTATYKEHNSVSQFVLPFAGFDTGLVSDPLALELGEAGESALQLAFESDGLSASIFAFNGGVDYKEKDRITDVGVQADYEIELGGIGFSAGVGWINDVAESDTLEDAKSAGDKRVAGLAAHMGLTSGPLSFSGHYMAARDKLEEVPWSVMEPDVPKVVYDGKNDSEATNEPGVGMARPSAYGVELGYAFDTGGREIGVAAGYQRTREALALEMPETRILIGISTELVEGVGLALEFARHNDYGANDCTGWEIDNAGTEDNKDDIWSSVCGTGKSGSTLSLLLSAEF